MENFNKNEYSVRLLNILQSAFYNDNPTETRLTELRKYTEIIVRKILDIGSDSEFMLGDLKNRRKTKIKKIVNGLDVDRKNVLLEIVDRVKKISNEGTHTQRIEEFTEEEFNEALNALFDLIAYLFVDYFKKFPMELTSPNDVMYDFSLMPPIIRFKTLDMLYQNDPNNVQILNRLVLARIKTFGKPDAYRWLEFYKDKIEAVPYPTVSEINDYIAKCGIKFGPNQYLVSIKLDQFDNVYDLLKDKIDDSRTTINESGRLYNSFEQALTQYRIHRHPDSHPEITELHEIMDFVYMGRQSE